MRTVRIGPEYRNVLEKPNGPAERLVTVRSRGITPQFVGSYAFFHLGGAEWDRWNRDMKEALLSSQRTGETCETGSWDPIGEWGYRGGRVYSTALAAMTLEVYYRFRVAETGAAAGGRP